MPSCDREFKHQTMRWVSARAPGGVRPFGTPAWARKRCAPEGGFRLVRWLRSEGMTLSEARESGREMYVVGVDLSGPANPDGTAVAVFRAEGAGLVHESLIASVTDTILFTEIREKLAVDDVCVGLDAPLSYGALGGQRRSDAELRERVVKAGLAPGSVMAPTAPRMAYLTLRGLSVARGLQYLGGPGQLRVVETHPGAALALGGAPIDAIRGFRESLNDRERLLRFLTDRGLRSIKRDLIHTDHSVAACAAAWATWRWMKGESAWLYPAEPPNHPFDFAC